MRRPGRLIKKEQVIFSIVALLTGKMKKKQDVNWIWGGSSVLNIFYSFIRKGISFSCERKVYDKFYDPVNESGSSPSDDYPGYNKNIQILMRWFFRKSLLHI